MRWTERQHALLEAIGVRLWEPGEAPVAQPPMDRANKPMTISPRMTALPLPVPLIAERSTIFH